MKENKPYQSLACSLYDNLEALATRKTTCDIVFRVEEKIETITSTIVDIFSNDGAEFLRLENYTVIRLDNLITVNGIEMNSVC